ncbi:cell division protein SepF [Lactobacillus sp. DCY120]|uniref:Cell division protein SepF n=1 Tax=Bombilactobacillus apium TaxID=2675299 RepID=A0A850R010_9LACO|nr:cell division protein SepF [Bombilactobacillus apium]NVY95680.1 cell division protein SepF [Bombilactobacillus apium]
MAFEKLADFFGMTENSTDDYEEETTDEDSVKTKTSQSKIVALKSKSGRRGVIQVVQPHSYADTKEVAQNLLNDQAVLVNFTQVSPEQMCRITDFLAGTIYAIKGDIRRVDTSVILYTPASFQIDSAGSNFTE